MPTPSLAANFSLDQLAEAIAASAYLAYSHSLEGHVDSDAHRYYQWCTKIQPGQLVLEITMNGRVPALRRLGLLTAITEQPVDNWDVGMNGPAPTRVVYRIERLNGETIDWENCTLIAVPQNPFVVQGPR